VRSAWAHAGPARTLVHRLKYQGIEPAALVLGLAMAPLLEGRRALLVPIPRLRMRAATYGIDPGPALASVLSRLCGLPVADLLNPGWFGAGRARLSRNRRIPPMFSVDAQPRAPVVLVDDVVTTGGTAASAASTLPSVVMVVTATAAPGVASVEGSGSIARPTDL
jgi:predicted amidophosphoribosyltransferase